MALATGAAVVGAAATAAYLDAKYHLTKDVKSIRQFSDVAKIGADLVKSKRLCFFYPFEESALRLKDETCLWYRPQLSDPVQKYTWTHTYKQACRYAQFLLENGVRPGELVGTYLQNSPEFIFATLGSWAIGCAPALINFNLAGDGLVHCLKVSGTKVLLVDEAESCRQRVEEVRSRIEALGMRILILDAATRSEIESREPVRPGNELRDVVQLTSPMSLIYTSGTTGLPKACPFPMSRSILLGKTRLTLTELKAGPDGDTWYNCMPLYHGTGMVAAVSCLIVGQTLAIGRRFSARSFWHDIHDSGANAFVYVGETARYLLAAPPSPLDKDHKLKIVWGNGLRPDIWAKFQERFNIPCVHEFFNSTEGVLGLYNVCKGPFHTAHVGHQGLIHRFLTRNLWVPVEIDIEKGDQIWRDPKTGFARRTTYEQGGEILVAMQSEKEFIGYWDNPGATAKRFERDVFRKGDLFYRSGDALRRDSEGRWHFLDRLGDTYRWKSENVSTAEVAETLGQYPGLVEANVYGVAVPGHEGRAGCAAVFIVADAREKYDYAGLLRHAQKKLPRYAVPVFLRLIQSPTPMHNNKQNKVPLRNEGVDPEKIASGAAGPNDIVMWAPPGADKYVPFQESDWKAIVGGQRRL